jgi:preprotein translocase subunit SecD
MTSFQHYKERYFCFQAALALMAMALFTTTITAAELPEAQSWAHRFEVRLASHEKVTGWEGVTDSESAKIVWISPEVTLTNADVVLAELIREPNNKCSISLSLTEDGSQKFARLTKFHIGWVAVIMIDGRVVVAPTIKSEIPDGRISITGDFTEEEARPIAAGIAVRHNSAKENNKK